MDFHAISFHQPDADSDGALTEYRKGLKFMHKLYKLFPKVQCCISNHTARPYRKANDAGIPSVFLKGYRDMMEAPKGWSWDYEFNIDGVNYSHGMEASGREGALNLAINRRISCAIGHHHSFGGVKYHANNDSLIFGLNSGCLIDVHTYAFKYGKNFKYKPTIGCGVVINSSEAYFVPMNLGTKIKRL